MTTTSNVSPPMNHVFVDFENVHHIDLVIIGTKAVSLTILVGAKQTKLDAELVVKLFEHAASVQLIRLTASENNAVDFAITYYLGRAVLADPTAYFHIISKDTGYEPLIEHLQSRHVRVRRHNDFTTLTFAAPPKAAPTAPKTTAAGSPDPMNLMLDRLRKHTTNRPKKKKTLLSHLKANLGKEGSDADATQLLEKLIKAGHIEIDDKEGVTYQVKKSPTLSGRGTAKMATQLASVNES